MLVSTLMRRIVIAALFALALDGCATNDTGYRHSYADGSYRGRYDDGYYAASADGYGDYYYDRPQVVINDYSSGFYGGYGYGFGFYPGRFGFGARFGYDPWLYNPWYGYGYPYGWYRPWPRHHQVVPLRGDAMATHAGDRQGVQLQSVRGSVNNSGRRVDDGSRTRDLRRGDDGSYRRSPMHGRNFENEPRERNHESSGRQPPRDTSQR